VSGPLVNERKRPALHNCQQRLGLPSNLLGQWH